MRRARQTGHAIACAIAAIAMVSRLGGAQSGRISGVTWFQSVDLRPLVEDSVPVGDAVGTGPYRQLADGRLVRCVEGEAFCRLRRSGSRATAMPIMQDFQGAAWGFGEGISLHAHVRARESIGNNNLLWPRADDRFDALEAYLQVDRPSMRARVGRQWATNSLGVHNFDGGSLLFRGGSWTAEGFGGYSLVAGLNEPYDGGTLGTLDDLPPDDRAYLVGAKATQRFANGLAVGGLYQRVIRADRGALYSERFAVDASARLFGATVDATYAHDLMTGTFNEARVRATRELPRHLSASVDLRRHRPFFEWWTIWGAFSPVAFDEVTAIVGWRDGSSRLSLDASGGWRQYDETSAGLESTALRTDGWRAGVGAEWSATERWFAYADYNVDIGFGASRSDASGGFRWMPGSRYAVGGFVSALQNIYEFRVGRGRVYGVGIDGSARMTSESRVVFDAALYAHRPGNGAPITDWSQRRVSLRLEWALGRDPGVMTSSPRQPVGGAP